jgi:uncharacterized protein YkwD
MNRPGTIVLLAAALSTAAIAQWKHFGDAASPTVPSLARDMVAAHNAVRVRVGSAPLTWSDQLAGVAQKWADHLLASGQFSHSHNPNFGENLFEINGAPATVDRVVKDWADEARDYDYTLNTCRAVCGHYTQIVWSTTKEVGCAVARGGRSEIWVCNYNPPGNYVGQKPY